MTQSGRSLVFCAWSTAAKQRLPDHLEGIQKAPVEPGTHAGGREIGAAFAFGQDQVVVGVGQQPVLEPVQSRGGLRAAKGDHDRLVV